MVIEKQVRQVLEIVTESKTSSDLKSLAAVNIRKLGCQIVREGLQASPAALKYQFY